MAGATREYRTDEIVVTWNADRCIHTANCIRSLPAVFNPMDRPWIHIERANADQLAAAVQRCPTGALHFRRLDGGAGEQPSIPTRVTVVPDGPLYVRGAVAVQAEDGAAIREDTRMALCRCGESANKPFCDNSHRRVNFHAPVHIQSAS